MDERKPMLSYLDPEPDAISDVLVVTYYFYLADLQYPGSKFILTLRDSTNGSTAAAGTSSATSA